MNSDKINATIIIEVLGKPKEHLVETLEKIIEKISQEKGIEIKDKKINEPQELKDKKEFFTNFAEIELEFDNAFDLMILIFKYMPANIQINYPEKITLDNSSFTAILNELARRLHGYDEIARVIQMEKKILTDKLRSLLKNKDSEKKE
jgi:hypothetical protein